MLDMFGDSGLLTDEDDFNSAIPEEKSDSDEPVLIPGFVNSDEKITVRVRPEITASILCMLDPETEVMINEDESNYFFYKVITPAGIEGYSVKKFITLRE